MQGPEKRNRAGPLGRAHVSPVLMRRPQGDPRVRRNAALLATGRRTAVGVRPVVLDYVGVPLPVEDQLRVLESRYNELVAILVKAGLMDRTL